MLEESLQGFTGHLKVQVAGPWTLAATVERPRGDKVLADHGDRRELAQALAEGVRDHLADVRRRVPGAGPLLLQVDEPALAAVLRARGTHRLGVRPAPRGGPARALRAPGVGVRGGHRVGRGALGALVRAGDAPRPAARRRRPRAVGRTSRAGLRRPRRARRGPRGRGRRGARRRTRRRPRHGAHRPSSSPTRCSAGSTCSASTRTWSVSGSSSPRPAAWRAPLRRGPARPRPVPRGRGQPDLTGRCGHAELFGSPEHLSGRGR